MVTKGQGVDDLKTNELNIISFKYIPMIGLTAEFSAMITSFKDSYKSSWDSQEVYGRMDPIGVFKGTRRTISFAFDVPSWNQEDAADNHEQIQNLIKMTYPVYETRGHGANSLVAAPLIKLRFGNLAGNLAGGDTITDLVGYLESGVDYAPDFGEGVFYHLGNMIPKLFKVDINFVVLHTHELGFDIKDGWTNIAKEDFFTDSTLSLDDAIYKANREFAEKKGLSDNDIVSNVIDEMSATQKINILTSNNNNTTSTFAIREKGKVIRSRFPPNFPYKIGK